MTDKRPEITDYLLGELSPEDQASFEGELAANPALAAEVAELGDIVTKLESLPDEAWEAPAPPPLRLAQSIASEDEGDEPAAAAPREAKPGIFERLFGGSISLNPGIAMASVMLIFAGGLAVGLLTGGSNNSASSLGSSQQQASLAPIGEIDPSATGQADIKKGGQVIRLKLSGLKPSGDADFYEAWLMDPKNGFISVGTFRVGADGETTLDLPVPVGTKKFPVVDISLQPVNGKPTHSGVSVLRGTLN
jgi:anti-sigma-K factor RskA